MVFIKRDGYGKTKDIVIEDGKKALVISFGGTLDLYWSIINIDRNNDDNMDDDSEIRCESFLITKENYLLYEQFLKLYEDIKNINLFDNFVYDFPLCIANMRKKEMYRKNNYSNYRELFNNNEKIITWYSDEVSYEVGNYVKIRKMNDEFLLEFFTQPQKIGYESEFDRDGIITIRFRNSGSRYDPFNVIFMRMFHNLQEIDDVNSLYHQIHICEYLYNNMKRKKNRN